MSRLESPWCRWRTRGLAFRQKTCRMFLNASTRGVRTRRTPWPAAVWGSHWPRKSSRRIGGGSGSKATWAKGRQSISPCPWPEEKVPHEPDHASLRRALTGVGAHLARLHFSAQREALKRIDQEMKEMTRPVKPPLKPPQPTDKGAQP